MPELCNICATPTTRFCTGCEKAYYCSVECQRNDWVGHREHCYIGSDKTSRTANYYIILRMLGEHYFAEHRRWLENQTPTQRLDKDFVDKILKAPSPKYASVLLDLFITLWGDLIDHMTAPTSRTSALERNIANTSRQMVDIWLKDSGFRFPRSVVDRKRAKIADEWQKFLGTLLNFSGMNTRERLLTQKQNDDLARETAETIATGD